MRKTFQGICVVAVLSLMSIQANGAGVSITPGKWETTTTLLMPMMEQPQTTHSTDCIADEKMDPVELLTGDNKCNITDNTAEGNKVTWKMVCATESGPVNGSGEFTSDGDSAEGRMSMDFSTEGRRMTMEMIWKGKRIGDCG